MILRTLVGLDRDRADQLPVRDYRILRHISIDVSFKEWIALKVQLSDEGLVSGRSDFVVNVLRASSVCTRDYGFKMIL